MRKSKGLTFRLYGVILAIVGAALIAIAMNMNISLSYAEGGATYYVATTGDDSNDGSLQRPWRTIQKAADTLMPGDTVYVRGGIYSEFVTITTSGTPAEGHIIYRNYRDEIPILDGKAMSPIDRSLALVRMTNVSYVQFAGFEIRNLYTTVPASDPAGIRVSGSGDGIQLRDNNVHRIENSSRTGNAHGIHIRGNEVEPIRNLVLEGNEVHHLITGRSESVTLSGNIDGFQVVDNEVYQNNNIGIVLAGYYKACDAPCTDQARNGIVANNIVHHIDSSNNPAYGTGIHAAGGIYVDGGRDILIERNETYSNDFGIEVASEKQGRVASNVVVRENYIHHNYGAGLIMGGSKGINGGAARNEIVNNTFVENDMLDKGYGDITLQWNNDNNVIYNNIIYSSRPKVLISKDNSSGAGNRIDYNLLYYTGGQKSMVWRWEGVSYSNWDQYKQATGFDKHSIYGNPMFVDKAANDVHLRANSAAIDKGAKLNSAKLLDIATAAGVKASATAIRGAYIDMGAYEYDPAKDTKPKSLIEVDGDLQEWNRITVLSTSKLNNSSLKALITQDTLYLSVHAVSLAGKSQFYIDSDNNANTGFKVRYWSSSGADYLVENGSLYRFKGRKDTEWSWERVSNKNLTAQYAASDSTIELAITLSEMGARNTKQIRIGYINDDNSKTQLPSGGALSSMTVSQVHK